MCEKVLKPHPRAKQEPKLQQKLVLITQILDDILTLFGQAVLLFKGPGGSLGTPLKSQEPLKVVQ